MLANHFWINIYVMLEYNKCAVYILYEKPSEMVVPVLYLEYVNSFVVTSLSSL
jgi:hypothetical protein